MKFVSILSALILGIGGPAFAQDRTVTIATEGAYPPFNLTQPDGKLAGFEIDLAKELCNRAKLDCQLIIQSFDGLIPGIQAAKFDAVMDSIQITPKREEVVAFSAPYLSVPSTFAVTKGDALAAMPVGDAIYDFRHDAAAAESAAQALKPLLAGKTVGVQTASVQAAFIDAYLKDVVTVREYQKVSEEMLDLQGGRLDAVFGQLVVLTRQLEKPQFSELTLSGPRFTGGIIGKGIGIAVGKQDDALRQAFDKAIAAMQDDRSLSGLSVKWFGLDISTRP